MTQPRTSAVVVRAEVTTDAISAAELAKAVEHRAAGAVVTFDGMVRDHDGGRAVTALTYEAHPSADAVVAQIAAEVAARPGLRAVALVHRVGDLTIGQTALAVAVSADHRAPAFEAVRDLVEEVKTRLPVWKHQAFTDGTRTWSNLA
ncbi:molybdenum cofactor biosynthesis protein MoaE [Actinomyces trachealis]|uniref:molybdenum cofactor biosynthesis protein MoaE n=1 Tax=Actinomyces trachealis TaxID=2763540 RepID=UPI001892A46F|nr:molybdenum cofactor biosynthesis protein MoaE [Actinomyces trachealis]